MPNATYKRNLRSFCRRFKIRAADIVAGTGLTDSQVAEMYNPNSVTHTRLDHAFLVVQFLRERTNTAVNLDYLMGDHNFATYEYYTKSMLKHFEERKEGLNYYAEHLSRLQREQDDFIGHLSYIAEILDPLDTKK
ncbi:MAG: hypothetical protein VXB01_08605 [Opitutae bacterium]